MKNLYMKNARLSETEFIILISLFVSGATASEISTEIGLTTTSIKRILNKVRRSLQVWQAVPGCASVVRFSIIAGSVDFSGADFEYNVKTGIYAPSYNEVASKFVNALNLKLSGRGSLYIKRVLPLHVSEVAFLFNYRDRQPILKLLDLLSSNPI